MEINNTSTGKTMQEKLTLLGQEIDPAYTDSKRICGNMRRAASERIE